MTGKTASLTVSALSTKAQEDTGLDDWGDDLSFHNGLEVLVDALEALPRPPREGAAQTLTGLLATRLRLVADERAHPDVTAIPVRQPLIVAGLPRSGTTVIYDLLALDPAARAPLEWEATIPWPAPEPATYETDPRIAQVEATLDAFKKMEPRLPVVKNPYSATTPAECNTITAFHFASPNFWASWSVPEYVEWLASAKDSGKYATHRRVLQQLAWHRPAGRWTLKGPEHAGDLEGLLAAYPDACIVQTHRHPRRTIASVADMVVLFQNLMAPPADPHAVGRSALRLWSVLYGAGVESRRDPAIDDRVFDVAFRDVVVDPVGTVRRIYDYFGLPLSEEYAARMRAFMAEHPRNKFGVHRYAAEDFVLSDAEIDRAFDSYLAAYGKFVQEP